MITARIDCIHVHHHRLIRCIWIGGRLMWVTREFMENGFREHCPWKVIRLYYSGRRDAYLCLRLDWMSVPNELTIPEIQRKRPAPPRPTTERPTTGIRS